MQIYTIKKCFTNNYYKLKGKSLNPKEYKQNKKDEKEINQKKKF